MDKNQVNQLVVINKNHDEEDNTSVLNKKGKIQWSIAAFFGFIAISTIGGLVFQFYEDIMSFLDSTEESLINLYLSAPPFVQGFITTAAILFLIALFISVIIAMWVMDRV